MLYQVLQKSPGLFRCRIKTHRGLVVAVNAKQTRHTTSYDITSSDRPISRRCAQLFRVFIIKYVLKIHIFHSTGVHQWTACLMPAIYSCKYITSKRPTRTGAHPVDSTRLPLTPRRFQARVLQRCGHLAAACSC
jgi:hypothetical protein